MIGPGKRLSLAMAIMFVLMALSLAAPLSARAGESAGAVDYYRMGRAASEGNENYHEGMYERARASYMRAKDLASEKSDEARKLHYNIGSTFYKEGKYEEAEKEFQQALGAGDDELRARAHYNLGNVNFKKGLQKNEIGDLEKAVTHYQETLRIDPDDEDAKFNIEVVRRLIKQEKQKQQQQQNPRCDNNQGSQGDQGEGDKKEGDNKKEQGREGEQNQDGQDEKKPGERDNKEEGADKREGEDQPTPSTGAGDTAAPQDRDEQQKPAGSDAPPEEISPEEAKRLLEAIRKKEKDDLKEMLRRAPGSPPSGGRDW